MKNRLHARYGELQQPVGRRVQQRRRRRKKVNGRGGEGGALARAAERARATELERERAIQVGMVWLVVQVEIYR